jgi:type I restriction enzyme S subunit
MTANHQVAEASIQYLAEAAGQAVPVGYKQTEVGVIPEDWNTKSLGELYNLKSGLGITAKSIDEYGLYPCFGGNGLRGFAKSFTHDGKYALIGRQGALCGNVQYVAGKFFASEHALVITPFKDVNPRWLAIYLERMNLNQYSESSAQPGLSAEKLRFLKLITPTTGEQTAIANALSDVDALINELEKLIAKKQAIKTATMQQLLTGRTRLPQFALREDGTLKDYKQSELGEIPEDWEILKLGQLGKFKNGINKDGASFGYGFPFVNLMDVFGKPTISSKTDLGLINSTELDRKEYGLKEGDILFIRSSVKPSGVGLTTVIQQDLEDTVYSGFLIRYRSGVQLSNKFKEHCFYEEGFRNRIIAGSTVSANTNINQDTLKEIMLGFPQSTLEQSTIATILSDMDAEIQTLQQRLSKTRQIKQGMMQELLTGKTRLI